MCTVLRMHGQFILHVLHCSLVGITAILYELLCCMLETLNSCLHMFSHLYVLTAQANQPVSFLLHKRIYSACVSEAWLNLCPKSGMHHMWLPYSVCSCPPPPPGGSMCILGCLQNLKPINPRDPCKPCQIATHHMHQLMDCCHMLPLAKCTSPVSFQLHNNLCTTP